MKKATFSEVQIAFIWRQTDERTPVAEVCRKAGISDAAFDNWCKLCGSLTPSEVEKMRQVEVLTGQSIPQIDAIRQMSVTEQNYYR